MLGQGAGQAQGLRLYYLGPEGTFTQQAALVAQTQVAQLADQPIVLEAVSSASAIVERVAARQGWGVLAWENNVEGTVVPNMDALIDSPELAGFGKVSIDIVFDAFVRPDHGRLTEVCAHPHGLAQCRTFTQQLGLTEVAASSNAAACRDIGPQQVALGPRVCGQLYQLETLQGAVQDFQGAHTDFLLLCPRDQAHDLALAYAGQTSPGQTRQAAFETILAVIPLQTGPGVLANLLDRVRDAGLNMTSFMSRPIKGHDGTYSFVASLDAAPWQPQLRELLTDFVEHDVWSKTLAVCPRTLRQSPPIDQWMLPKGGVVLSKEPEGLSEESLEKELLW